MTFFKKAAMRQSFLSIVFLFLYLCSFSQTDVYNQNIMDPKADQEILIGYCTRDGLMSSPFSSYLKEGYAQYKPDVKVIKEIQPKIKGVTMTIIMGTWCSDSQEQVPKFFKILDKIHFSKKNIQLICVDSDKKAGDVDLVNYNIQKVPTFIVYKKGREIGRIVETPYASLEKDLLMFFND